MDDGFFIELRQSSPDNNPEPQSSPTPSLTIPESPKPASVALNRFMVSRFSITHVSDSNASQVTGQNQFFSCKIVLNITECCYLCDLFLTETSDDRQKD